MWSKSCENCCAFKLFVHMLCEIFKEKNKNFIHNELSKIAMLPKINVWTFRD